MYQKEKSTQPETRYFEPNQNSLTHSIGISLFVHLCFSFCSTKRHGNDLNTVPPVGSKTTKNFGPRWHLTRDRQLLLSQEFLGRLIGKEERGI